MDLDMEQILYDAKGGWALTVEERRALAAEVEQLREWRREVCDVYGYDGDDETQAAEFLTYLPSWRGEAQGNVAEIDRLRAGREIEQTMLSNVLPTLAAKDAEIATLRAKVARVEALPDTWTDMDEDERIAHVVECKDYTCPDCPVIACIYDLSRALADPEPQS